MNHNSKKLLAIFPQLPLPEFAGDRQKVNNLIKILNKHFELHVVIITRQKPTVNDIQFLKLHSISYNILHLSKIKIIKNLIRGFFTKQPLQVSFFYNSSFQSLINQKAKSVDAVFCNLIRVAKYAENLDLPKYIDIVDSLSINYKRSAEKVTSWFWKLLYTLEYQRLGLYEEKIIHNFNASFLVNHIEYLYWVNKLKVSTLFWLPQGIKQELFTYTQFDNSYQNSVMFIGKMDYQPNIDAVIWFLTNVWPLVNSEINFYIVGINPPKRIQNLQKSFSNVHITGYIEDPYIIMNSCAAVVSPMLTGGGIQNKVLEAMAMGKVNITTVRGSESIKYAEKNVHLLVEDEPREMAKLIEKVVFSSNDYHELEQNAKNLAKKVYTWENFESEIITQTNTHT